MNDLKTIRNIKEWAEKNAKKYRDQFWDTGSFRTRETAERYEDIRDICELAERVRMDEQERRDGK